MLKNQVSTVKGSLTNMDILEYKTIPSTSQLRSIGVVEGTLIHVNRLSLILSSIGLTSNFFYGCTHFFSIS